MLFVLTFACRQHPLADTNGSLTANSSLVTCHPDAVSEATILLSLAFLGLLANCSLMFLIMLRNQQRSHHQPARWSGKAAKYHIQSCFILSCSVLFDTGLF